MLEVKLYDLGYCKDSELTRVVCVSKYKDDYVFCYNKKRQGWEIPGGHIEGNDITIKVNFEKYGEKEFVKAFEKITYK